MLLKIDFVVLVGACVWACVVGLPVVVVVVVGVVGSFKKKKEKKEINTYEMFLVLKLYLIYTKNVYFQIARISTEINFYIIA
jgi:hypothetical protein